MTRYHDAHDDEGRLCIRVDGKEYLNSHVWNGHSKDDEEMTQKGRFCYCEMLAAIDMYVDELTIDEALAATDPIVRLLAVLDRRIGKRRLPALAAAMENEPEWLRFFYQLRLEAEGLNINP